MRIGLHNVLHLPLGRRIATFWPRDKGRTIRNTLCLAFQTYSASSDHFTVPKMVATAQKRARSPDQVDGEPQTKHSVSQKPYPVDPSRIRHLNKGTPGNGPVLHWCATCMLT